MEKEFYLCKTDWDFELGECKCETYSSLESLRNDRKCISTCGAVKITMNTDTGLFTEEVVLPENRNYKE